MALLLGRRSNTANGPLKEPMGEAAGPLATPTHPPVGSNRGELLSQQFSCKAMLSFMFYPSPLFVAMQ